MEIAVACDGLNVSSQAANCESFMCYTTENGVLSNCRNLPNINQPGCDGAALIIEMGFDTLLTGGIDIDMTDKLCAAGIEVIAGIKGSPREAVDAYINDTLMGAVRLCHVHEDNETCEDDIDNAFDLIAQQLITID